MDSKCHNDGLKADSLHNNIRVDNYHTDSWFAKAFQLMIFRGVDIMDTPTKPPPPIH
jgi:hypothetical protein